MDESKELTGRALDAAVAVEVMGWTAVYASEDPLGPGSYEGPLDRLDYWVSEKGHRPCGWSPSTDGNAMLEVVAEMGRRGWAVEMWCPGDDSGASVEVIIPGVWVECCAEASTIPEALCRAALAAVRAQKGGRA